MKLRKHQGNRTYRITWAQRVAKGGKARRQPEIITEGQNPTAVLNAFLFGRDRTNIDAEVWLHEPGFPTLTKSGYVWLGVAYYQYGRRA